MALEDDLLKTLKERAAREGRTVAALISELLHEAIAVKLKPRFKLKLQGWKATEQPGVDLLDRDKLFDLMDSR